MRVLQHNGADGAGGEYGVQAPLASPMRNEWLGFQVNISTKVRKICKADVSEGCRTVWSETMQ